MKTRVLMEIWSFVLLVFISCVVVCLLPYRLQVSPAPLPPFYPTKTHRKRQTTESKQSKHRKANVACFFLVLLAGSIGSSLLLIISTIINFLKQSFCFLQRNFMEGFPLYILYRKKHSMIEYNDREFLFFSA